MVVDGGVLMRLDTASQVRSEKPHPRAGPSANGRPAPRLPHALRHVLVVEDDSPIRVMLADMLADAGYVVAEAINGFQALAHLKDRRPDLIVLDLMLPGMSGWEFLDRSRAQLERANVPVIVLSAIRGQGDYPATLGVAAWFTKPLDVQHFLGAVEQLAGPSKANAATPVPQAVEPARILVIEDEPLIGELITEHLQGEGFVVELVPTIEAASARIAYAPPDLILLDLMLPGRSGWELLRQRQHDAELAAIPVLVVSAAPQDRLLEAKELGADAFLSKPFDFDVLTALLRSYIL
jgi:DNA-binding response OmpR family regulator